MAAAFSWLIELIYAALIPASDFSKSVDGSRN